MNADENVAISSAVSVADVELNRIKGLSDERRLPRIGKIRLGERRISARTGEEYPVALDHFKFDDETRQAYPEIQEIYGLEPKELDVLLPADQQEVVFPQSYKLYGFSHGLKCKGNGERAVRFLCAKCHQLTCKHKDVERVRVEVKCPCDLLAKGECRPVGSLMVMLPRITCAGVFQIDTGSRTNIVDLNSGIAYVRRLCGRAAMVPLKLRRVPRLMHPGGRAVTVYTLQLVFDADLETIARIQSGRRPTEYVIEPPHDDGDELPATEATENTEGGKKSRGQRRNTRATEKTEGAEGGRSAIRNPQSETGKLPIDEGQKERIKKLRRELRLSAIEWDALLRRYDANSGNELDEDQADELIRELKARQSADGANDQEKESGPAASPFNRSEGIKEIQHYVNTAKDLTNFDEACARLGLKRDNWQMAGDTVSEKLLSDVRDLKAAKDSSLRNAE